MKNFLLYLFVLCTMQSMANNIKLADVKLADQNTTDHFSRVNLSVSWDNSWRLANNESNWDAAWIFVKFRKKGSTSWQHATLNGSGHTAATGSTITPSADGKGAFIYRSSAGQGTVNFTNSKIRWNYGADNVLDSDSVEVNVFATEMVYVPQGGFWLGSNGTENGHFRRGDKDSSYWVGSEAAINIGVTKTSLFASTSSYGGNLGTIPAAYPKGFNAFYCMKYEVSEQQYADFLNNLDLARATMRNIGNNLTGTHPNLIGNNPERAMDFASIADIAAFLDWSGLRPMTELEYEKASRGANIEPVPNEYAFGNTSITPVSGPINPGEADETVTSGNANYGGLINRPLRCGAFATASSTRESSGGSYYGIMELSGNMYEFVMTAGHPAGLTFTGMHGDGNLNSNGLTDLTNGVDVVTGWGSRGGSYNQAIQQLQSSDRFYGAYGQYISYTTRTASFGIRGVHAAP